MQDPNCVFCKIIAGEIPAKVIMQNEKAMALLDAFPLAAGHSLVVPKSHYAKVQQMSEQDAMAMSRQVLKLTLLQLQSTMEMRQARRCPMYMRILFQEKEAMVPVPSTLCSKLSQN
jgi:diadenosine tetraphosphate (Ap4A) HIT family hydrolase